MRRRKKLLVATITAVILVLAAVSFVFADFVQNSKPINNVTGTVTFRYGGGYFLKTTDGKEYKLVVGPHWYLEDLGLELKVGDKVTVDGALDSEQNILFVSNLKKGVRTYKIADPEKVLDNSYCHGPRSRFMGNRGHSKGRGMRANSEGQMSGRRNYNQNGNGYNQKNFND